ncbi:carbonic anhydrase [Methylocystis parvus]|uniref:Carbonic anhydrase n=1 Tax=Methylocystis parvus TaxID=134 RepID=A0A6B8M8S0_9HYPH|nr:carbonic anhydrase [Methylocystis parvus]QGM97703.1 carbonic anhydrase [Methylocystis parvus]WBJ98362.1 carbonic anhydrase [Methylocystis parvus OBBP]
MCQSCGFPDIAHGKEVPRRGFMFGAAVTGALSAAGAAHAKARKSRKAESKPEASPPKPENVMAPDAALARLLEGNKRYQRGVAARHDFVAEREALVGGQNPYAAILSCADSRIAPEYAFDSSRGDLFVCRVAGNFVSPENIASFEFAVEVLKTPLLLVLGHESCGAVKSAISSIADKTTLPGHLPYLVTALTPAVKAVAGQPGDELENATKENVRLGVEALKTATPLLSAAVNDKRIKIVGGVYRLENGKVEIFA